MVSVGYRDPRRDDHIAVADDGGRGAKRPRPQAAKNRKSPVPLVDLRGRLTGRVEAARNAARNRSAGNIE